jgi:hypothetical protein
MIRSLTVIALMLALDACAATINYAVIADYDTAIWLKDQVSYQHSLPSPSRKTYAFGAIEQLEDDTYVVQFDDSVWFLLWDGVKCYDNIPLPLLTKEQVKVAETGRWTRQQLLDSRGEVHEVTKP